MDKKIDIHQADLLEAFEYNRVDGNLLWKGGHSMRNKHLTVAGWVGSGGYRNVKFMGRCWLCHVLIWVMHHGQLTDATIEIDHIDRDPLNNRVENLRLVTRKENQANRTNSIRKVVA